MSSPLSHLSADHPYVVRIVIVSTYARGLQPWIEREKLHGPLRLGPFAEIYANDQGVVGLITGMGAINATASTLSFGYDARFDLRQAYWLIAGLGGIDPEDASLASAVWSKWIVDGDLVHEIDARELPDGWETGRLPLNTTAPYTRPPSRAGTAFGVRETYALNADLAEWAFALTRETPLLDTPAIATFRQRYSPEFPMAAREPFVLQGDTLAASTYWHGAHLNRWANRWVDFWTEGAGKMVITTMEDGGRAAALQTLQHQGRADFQRLMLLRTGCNYSRPPAGIDAAVSLGGDRGDDPFVGELASLENMVRVGGPVVDALLDGWTTFADRTPT